MLDQIGNPEDQFSQNEAHMYMGLSLFKQDCKQNVIWISAEEIRCVFDDNSKIIFVKSS